MVGCIDQYFKYDKKLPFLFKILSIEQPLSLQAHPDRKLAEFLHSKDPKNYPDSNHKPELAIALTNFEILCDFRPYKEILYFLNSLPPLKQITNFVDDSNNNSDCEALSKCFKTLMTCDKQTIKSKYGEIISNASYISLIGKDLVKLIANLNELYPGDPGVFAPFFLNYIELKPGEAVYLKANKLHAYIRGECIECMACSDNVVRAGLTTKYRDVDTLIKMLDYKAVKGLNDILFTGKTNAQDPRIVSYKPEDVEFKVEKIVINERNSKNQVEYQLPALSSGSFLIVLEGKACANNFFDPSTVHKLSLGSAAFVPPKTQLNLYNIHGNLTLYRAYS